MERKWTFEETRAAKTENPVLETPISHRKRSLPFLTVDATMVTKPLVFLILQLEVIVFFQ